MRKGKCLWEAHLLQSKQRITTGRRNQVLASWRLCNTRRELGIHYARISIVPRWPLPHWCLQMDPLLWSRDSWKQQRSHSPEKASTQQRRMSIVLQGSNQGPILIRNILHWTSMLTWINEENKWQINLTYRYWYGVLNKSKCHLTDSIGT